MGRWLARVVLAALFVAVGLMTGVARAGDSPQQIRIPWRSADGSAKAKAIVRPGDHLWKISARHLDELESESEVAPFWREVIKTNLPTLRSGDPDLIYPGEVIVLPEPSLNERP